MQPDHYIVKPTANQGLLSQQKDHRYCGEHVLKTLARIYGLHDHDKEHFSNWNIARKFFNGGTFPGSLETKIRELGLNCERHGLSYTSKDEKISTIRDLLSKDKYLVGLVKNGENLNSVPLDKRSFIKLHYILIGGYDFTGDGLLFVYNSRASFDKQFPFGNIAVPINKFLKSHRGTVVAKIGAVDQLLLAVNDRIIQ